MKPLTYRKEVRQFIGVLNYYRNMWSRLSHTLAPLTKITPSKVKFKWNKTKQDTFEELKLIVDRDTLLAYPDFNKELKIHTNASDFKSGAVISQNGKPIAFYSKKTNWYPDEVYSNIKGTFTHC